MSLSGTIFPAFRPPILLPCSLIHGIFRDGVPRDTGVPLLWLTSGDLALILPPATGDEALASSSPQPALLFTCAQAPFSGLPLLLLFTLKYLSVSFTSFANLFSSIFFSFFSFNNSFMILFFSAAPGFPPFFSPAFSSRSLFTCCCNASRLARSTSRLARNTSRFAGNASRFARNKARNSDFFFFLLAPVSCCALLCLCGWVEGRFCLGGVVVLFA